MNRFRFNVALMEKHLITVSMFSDYIVILSCYWQWLGSSPYVIDTSTLIRGEHNITFSVIINDEVRGLATETFTVLEGSAQ